MSLLLLLKPHPRRGGRGQQLVIESKKEPTSADIEAFQAEEDYDVARFDGGPAVLVPSVENLIKATPFLRTDRKLAEQFRKSYKQGLDEGLGIEEMLLLFMMTER